MTVLFVVLIVIFCVVLGFIVLIQNPKGGGLAGNVAGLSNQFMGVKQTTDVLEKGTWVFAAAVGILCLMSSVFMNTKSNNRDIIKSIDTKQKSVAPITQPPAPVAIPAPDSMKK
jgi:preprotein translocase subunit SecG